MDDLSGLTFPASSTSPATYPALRPTPPPSLPRLQPQASKLASSTAISTPTSATDSFANLVSFSSARNSPSPSLLEQQRRLQAQKQQQADAQRRKEEEQFGNVQFWNGLGGDGGSRSGMGTGEVVNGNGTGKVVGKGSAKIDNAVNDDDKDLFAAFNKNAQVDRSSFYPPPSRSTTSTPLQTPPQTLQDAPLWTSESNTNTTFIDDDTFGLGQMNQKAPLPVVTDDSDDFLGDLAKPVEEIRKHSPAPVPAPAPAPSVTSSASVDPFDRAVAELVDMGFTPEQSRQALTENGSGLNIQAAVSWILNEAHRQAKKQSGASNGASRELPPRRDNSSELDLSKAATAMGNNLFKTANSLWKTSQKKVQRAVADLQAESDAGQPRWMREAMEREQMGRPTPKTRPDVTDEAMMLEGRGPPPRRNRDARADSSRDQSPAIRPADRASPVPRWQPDPRARLNKQAAEEQSASAYVSPARRKKTPQPQATVAPPADLNRSVAPPVAPPVATKATPTRSPVPSRPKPPPRRIPHLSSIALQSSNQHRLAGTEHFKRGDYAAAHQSYADSLSALPAGHPITIILFCNHALTALKTGIPKQALEDTDNALTLVGPSRGEFETISLGIEEKSMKDFWAKALTRKAEALEQMERWADARSAWHEAVEAGVGGATAIQGRQRCDKALAPKVSKPPPKRVPNSSSSTTASSAVTRLRAANAAAERADDEKFALADAVAARIDAWRNGKRENLRALLGSLDQVLWPDSGWTRIGMHELVTVGKVKISYMRAIAKCHPDKVRAGGH